MAVKFPADRCEDVQRAAEDDQRRARGLLVPSLFLYSLLQWPDSPDCIPIPPLVRQDLRILALKGRCFFQIHQPLIGHLPIFLYLDDANF